MSKLKPSNDSRTSFDDKNGALRSFFGSELIEPSPEEKDFKDDNAKGDNFLKTNEKFFKLKDIALSKAELREGKHTKALRYNQLHNNIPVYRAQLVLGINKRDQKISSAINKVDYEIPDNLSPDKAKLNDKQAGEAVKSLLSSYFKTITYDSPTLYFYRHEPDDLDDSEMSLPTIRKDMLNLGEGKVGKMYLAWQVMLKTEMPGGSWEAFLDSVSGKLITIKDRRRYATRKGYVYWPDPIRSSQNSALSSSTDEATLNNERREVDILNLNNPVSGKYTLDGTNVTSQKIEDPDFPPPETTGDFKYGAKSLEFLSVMAYYYMDRFISDIKGFGITEFNNAVTQPIRIDAQGVNGENNSYFDPTVPYSIVFGTDTSEPGGPGIPDAADPGVVVHEYGHAIHTYIGSEQSYYDEHMFCDFLAVAWVDQFNDHQYARSEMFPWDNNAANQWSSIRRVDLTQKFSDAGYSGYGSTLKGAIGATAMWDCYLNLGGNSSNAYVRKWAADELIATYMEMLVATASNSTTNQLVNGLITADRARTGGLYSKVIWDAFRRRGLSLCNNFTPTGNVDLYIKDTDSDTGEHASPQIHWTSPDIWVRNSPPPADPSDPSDPNYSENPDDGHQPPINDVPNYLYVRVHNRGSQAAAANSFTLEAFHCNPSTAMLYPDHFHSMGTLPITVSVPANGGSVRVGPFIWTPHIVDHECLLAVVRGSSDPSIIDDVEAKGSVDHWKIVRFENNVGQRNVSPAPSTPGGKTKVTFLVRGTDHPSTNTLNFDASTLPTDTKISIRIASSIPDEASNIFSMIQTSKGLRWTTLGMTGGVKGSIVSFPLEKNAEKSVTISVDFSLEAENLKRYPIIVSQEQDGVIAGQLTIEITAVKESEDYLYGNIKSLELHRLNCPYRIKMNPKNQRPFQNAKEALIRGYNGCAFCMPEINNG